MTENTEAAYGRRALRPEAAVWTQPHAAAAKAAARPRDFDVAADLGIPTDRLGSAAATQEPSLGPIADAFRYATDRLDRVEHVLGDLNGVLERLRYDLRPVLTADGEAMHEPALPAGLDEPTPEDRRSTVARRIARLGIRADQLADVAGLLRDKVACIVEELELEGVAR